MNCFWIFVSSRVQLKCVFVRIILFTDLLVDHNKELNKRIFFFLLSRSTELLFHIKKVKPYRFFETSIYHHDQRVVTVT